MNYGHPVTSMAESFYSALKTDLPDINYKHRSSGSDEEEIRGRRPREDELAVIQFDQTWGSTALGFGGIGGASITTAPTTIVHTISQYAVYFAGKHAYTIEDPNRAFFDDVQYRDMVSVAQKGKYLDSKD